MSVSRRVIALLAVLLLGASCTNPGYRTEVYPGEQGQFAVRRVPVDPKPQPAAVAVAPAAATPMAAAGAPPVEATPAVPSDPNLATLESLWPQLTASDRAAVVDMTRHLAGRPAGSP